MAYNASLDQTSGSGGLKKLDKGDLFRALIRRGHNESSARNLLSRLERDDLIDEVVSGFRMIALMDAQSKLSQRLKLKSPRGRETSLQRAKEAFFSTLEEMMDSDRYNKRGWMASLTGKKPAEEWRKRITQVSSVVKPEFEVASEELLKTVSTGAKPLAERVKKIIAVVQKEGVEPQKVREGLVLANQRLDRALRAGDLELDELLLLADDLLGIEATLIEIERIIYPAIEGKRELEEALNGLKPKLEELKKIEEEAAKEGVLLDFVKAYVGFCESLAHRLRAKCNKAGAKCYRDALGSTAELEGELTGVLESARAALALVGLRREIAGSAHELKEACSYLDLRLGGKLFSGLHSQVVEGIGEMSEEVHLQESGSLQELVEQAEGLKGEIDTAMALCNGIVEMSRRSTGIEKLLDSEEKREIIGSILSRDGPSLQEKTSSILKVLEESVPAEKEAPRKETMLEDLERLYPILKRRVLASMGRKDVVKLTELEMVPEQWREWVAKRIAKEEPKIVLSDGALLNSDSFAAVDIRLEEVEQKISRVEQLAVKLEKLGIHLSGEKKSLDEAKRRLNGMRSSPQVLVHPEMSQAAVDRLTEIDNLVEGVLASLRSSLDEDGSS